MGTMLWYRPCCALRAQTTNMWRFGAHHTNMRCWWLVFVLCLAAYAQKPPDDDAEKGLTSKTITKTASNAQQGALAGTAIAPDPNQHGKTGPDDKYFVDAAIPYQLWQGTMWVVFCVTYTAMRVWF